MAGEVKADVSSRAERRGNQTVTVLNARLGGSNWVLPPLSRLLERGPGPRALPADPLRQSQAAGTLQGQGHIFSGPGSQLQLELEWWEGKAICNSDLGQMGGLPWPRGGTWVDSAASLLTHILTPDHSFLAAAPHSTTQTLTCTHTAPSALIG